MWKGPFYCNYLWVNPYCFYVKRAQSGALEAPGALDFTKDFAKDFIQRTETLFFQEIFGVFGKGVTKASINFIQNTTKDIDGFESWGLFVNIKKKALYNLFESHLKGIGKPLPFQTLNYYNQILAIQKYIEGKR